MTVLDIERPTDSAVTDTESNADEARRLHLMEEMMLSRGYSRNQHGFWVAPGPRMTVMKFEAMSEDEQ